MPLTIEALETPVPLVDLDRLERNLDRVAAYATEHHLALRPHVKTHKSPRIAMEQLNRGASGLTCATPLEAEVMSGICKDILIAYPPVGAARVERLGALPRDVKLTVALDSIRALAELSHVAHVYDRPIGIYIELDVGMRRVGTSRVDVALEIARDIRQRPPLYLAGLAFYPGHIRETGEGADAKLAQIATFVGEVKNAFEREGMSVPIISGGSTPTLFRSHEIAGLTEIRPGTYVYNDRTTAASGACDWDDCALTVLATVVSTTVGGQAVIDAGTKALGREPVRGAEGEGFGAVLGEPDAIVKSMSEEHGILDHSRTLWRPKVGDQVRIVPNHVCIVVHLNDVIVGVRGNQVEETWPVLARGRGFRIPV